MGRCWKCNTELRLIGKQWLCDNCNKPIGYQCWNCGWDFTIRDPLTKKNLKECHVCGFYYCPEYNHCASDCQKIEWQHKISNILAGQINSDSSLLISNPKEIIIQKIIQLIEDSKKECKLHKICPNGVYLSYAKGNKREQGKIKQLLSKMNGVGTKSSLDAEGFKQKLKQILTMKPNSTFTIKDLREDRRYGQEERDACNLGICLGELKAELITNKNNQKGIIYTKIIPEGKCSFLRQDNFVTKRCPHCHKDYNNSKMSYYQPNLEFYPNCIYKKGKKKNSSYSLIIKETNTSTCNCPLNMFKKIEENGDKDGDREGE